MYFCNFAEEVHFFYDSYRTYERPLHKLTLRNCFEQVAGIFSHCLVHQECYLRIQQQQRCKFFVIIIKYCMAISIIIMIVVDVCHTTTTSPMLELLYAILKNYHVDIRKCISGLNQEPVWRICCHFAPDYHNNQNYIKLMVHKTQQQTL